MVTILSCPLRAIWGTSRLENVFLATSALAGSCSCGSMRPCPRCPPAPATAFNTFALEGKWVLAGMGGIICSYGGYHVFFTYLRPFLEHDLALRPDTLSAVLLAFGVANCLGTFAAGFVLNRWFRRTLPAVFPGLRRGGDPLSHRRRRPARPRPLRPRSGFSFGFIPVGWSAWIAPAPPRGQGGGGGWSPPWAVTQFSMGPAAAVGGVTFDHVGITGAASP
ncbi:MAG: hypothetical protein V8Q84_06035 [Bilophila sp.]